MKKIIVLALPIALALSPFISFGQAINLNTVYSTIGSDNATVYGSVNPGGITTTAWFEYSEDMNFLDYKETLHTFVGSQAKEFPVRATIKSLKGNTIYYVRIVADNTQGTIKGNTIMITTNPVIENHIISNTTNVNNNTVAKSANTKKVVETKIIYVEKDSSNTTNINSNTNSNYNSNTSYNNQNQSANVLFGYNNFMPNTFFGWLILILIVLAILSVIRRLFFYY